ncbi:hypothetical protein WA026_012295 [Henosepilachna vigintioctopunctata]|uniref:Uncharacterized protein n=1 Tax=Henosepilachna vigintioctopunctata TaxID=420089 RepID=A0AAW1UQU7_9CUCU
MRFINAYFSQGIFFQKMRYSPSLLQPNSTYVSRVRPQNIPNKKAELPIKIGNKTLTLLLEMSFANQRLDGAVAEKIKENCNGLAVKLFHSSFKTHGFSESSIKS